MIVEWLLRQAPKSDLTEEQIEDAAAKVLPAANTRGEARLIVADGSSGSAGSGWWARQLADDLCAAPGRAFRSAQAFGIVSAEAAQLWPSYRRTLLERVPLSGARAWLAHVRIDNCPATTVLGVRLLPGSADDGESGTAGLSEGRWEVISVGDSCMFQVRADHVVESVATQTRVPPVIRASSRTAAPVPTLRGGRWSEQDAFYLMTDALARWWRRRADEGGRPWALLDRVSRSDDEFASWVETQRATLQLEDDDITLLKAECGPC